ncbi:MAG: hypothetical protein L3K09_07005, partial [Thermoplasmata archaeon]|nr:hypothetical protein [Thermoplasmata archaeon]
MPGQQLPALLLALIFLLSVGAGSVSSSGGSKGLAGAPGAFVHPGAFAGSSRVSPGMAAHPTAPGPLGSPSVKGSFFGNNSTFASLPVTAQYCTKSTFAGSVTSYCYPQAQDPTVLTLANGDIGVGYSRYASQSGTTCTGGATNTVLRVAFSTSTDGGVHFGAAADIGNDTCSYLQAIEPSFALGAPSNVYGVFVEENKSTKTSPTYPANYNPRPTDALGFVASNNNGSSWGHVTTINSTGNIARPVIAAFGKTVYVVFENLSNSSKTYPAGQGTGSIHPIALEFLRSMNGGKSWTKPVALPGENSSMGYYAFAASIAVNVTGALEVTYATNRTCVQQCVPLSYGTFADDIVTIVSTNNATSWSPVRVAEPKLGEAHCWSTYEDSNTCYPADFGWTPLISSTFSPNGSRLLVAAAGSYPQLNQTLSSYSYYRSGVFASDGSSQGTNFTTVPVAADYNAFAANDYSLPAVGVSANGSVYVAYSEENESACPSKGLCSAFVGSTIEFVRVAGKGIDLGGPTMLSFARKAVATTSSFTGWSASVGFTTGGSPVIGFSLPFPDQTTTKKVNTTTYTNYTFTSVLSVAFPYSGPTVNVTFTETGLPGGSPWTFTIDGLPYTQSSTSVTVTNVPNGLAVVLGESTVGITYWEQVRYSSSSPSAVTFTQPTNTVSFTYAFLYGMLLSFEPTTPISISESFTFNGTTYSRDRYSYGDYVSPAFPWYFPAGTVLDLAPGAIPSIGYWNGSGNGSFTGYGSHTNITINGPIVETAWAIAAGVYNESFAAVGLPKTSQFQLEFNGSTLSGPATKLINVSGVGTGAYTVSAIQATSPNPGWEYFGTSSAGSTVVVPNTAVNVTSTDAHLIG